MPVMASMDIRNYPFVKELDLIVDFVAKAAFGTTLAAAMRWGPLMGGITSEQAREYGKLKGIEIMTAFESGPVVLGGKPERELPGIEEVIE